MSMRSISTGTGRRKYWLPESTGIDSGPPVVKKRGKTWGKVPDRLPYYLVLLPDWKGKKVVAGQQQGNDIPFHGKFYVMSWDGKTLRMAEALPGDTSRATLF